MLKNYFKTAWRNLIRSKGYSAINIGGLAAGMTVALAIGLWVYDELSYDKYFKNYWVAGLQTHPLIIQSLTDTNLIGVRFLPGGAYPFFKFPINKLSDTVVEADWMKQVAQTLGKQGVMAGRRVPRRPCLARSDLKVTLDGVQIKPARALGSWVAFTNSDHGGT